MAEAEIYQRLSALEKAQERFEGVATRLAERGAEHQLILHGAGVDNQGLITSVALLRADVRQLLDNTRWIKRTLLAAIIVPIGLIIVAVFWRGAFPTAPLPDPKDEFKRPPALHQPDEYAAPCTRFSC